MYRRSGSLVVCSQGSAFVAHEYALGIQHALRPELAAVIAAVSDWTTPVEAQSTLPFLSIEKVRSALRELHGLRLIEGSADVTAPRRRALERWGAWGARAAFFHFGTRDVPHVDIKVAEARNAERLSWEPAPPPLKQQDSRRRRVRLPTPRSDTALGDVMLLRRSWRRFGDGGVPLGQLSTLLGLTWGVQRWVHLEPGLRALKTAPSGGACHPLEAYLLARRVAGVDRGIYHYCPDRHELALVRKGLPRGDVAGLLQQPWFADCAAAVVMTAVWARVQWRYSSARAYRTVLIEAGHFGQSFALLATSMGLAPFCTSAFADSALETALGIDGVGESALYVVGVGLRPEGETWAPWPDPLLTARTTAPAWARRRPGRLRTSDKR